MAEYQAPALDQAKDEELLAFMAKRKESMPVKIDPISHWLIALSRQAGSLGLPALLSHVLRAGTRHLRDVLKLGSASPMGVIVMQIVKSPLILAIKPQRNSSSA